MIYVWKSLPESVRAVGLAVLAYGLYVAVAFDAAAVTDWEAYAIGVGTGLIQALGTAGLAQMGRK